jgi:hypothetical protein
MSVSAQTLSASYVHAKSPLYAFTRSSLHLRPATLLQSVSSHGCQLRLQRQVLLYVDTGRCLYTLTSIVGPSAMVPYSNDRRCLAQIRPFLPPLTLFQTSLRSRNGGDNDTTWKQQLCPDDDDDVPASRTLTAPAIPHPQQREHACDKGGDGDLVSTKTGMMRLT